MWKEAFAQNPQNLSSGEKEGWLAKLEGVSMGSDAFFPFRDNIDKANQIGTRYVAQPGGSLNDEEVIRACNEYGMVMALSKLRLFHH